MSWDNLYDSMKSNMMLSSENPPNIYLSITSTQYYSNSPTTYVNGYKVVKIPHTPFQSSPTWALASVSQLSTDVALGLTFGESEQVIYSFGLQNTMNVISRINGADGTVEWAYGYSTVITATS